MSSQSTKRKETEICRETKANYGDHYHQSHVNDEIEGDATDLDSISPERDIEKALVDDDSPANVSVPVPSDGTILTNSPPDGGLTAWLCGS